MNGRPHRHGMVQALNSKKPLHAGAFLSVVWAVRDSNPRPPRCKRGALNQLS